MSDYIPTSPAPLHVDIGERDIEPLCGSKTIPALYFWAGTRDLRQVAPSTITCAHCRAILKKIQQGISIEAAQAEQRRYREISGLLWS